MATMTTRTSGPIQEEILLALLRDGCSLQDLGEAFGVSREDVRGWLVALGREALRREARAARPRARCGSCDRLMPQARPRADGQPSFCMAPACRRAASRWIQTHDPAYRELERRRWQARKGASRARFTIADIRAELAQAGLPLAMAATQRQGLRREQAVAILARKGEAPERAVAAEFGVSRSTVNGIWSGRRWRDLQTMGAAATA